MKMIVKWCPGCCRTFHLDSVGQAMPDHECGEKPLWTTGNWTSYRNDEGAFLQRDGKGWWVYRTDAEGTILVEGKNEDRSIKFAPPAHPEPFSELADAQAWSMENQPIRKEVAPTLGLEPRTF